jgi:hypothetical protein
LLNEQRKGGLEIVLGRRIRNDESNIVNGRRVPTNRSRSFVVESARQASGLSKCIRPADKPPCLTIPPDTLK